MKLRSKIFIWTIVFSIFACSYYPEEIDRNTKPSITETLKYIKIGDQGNKALIFYPGGLVDPYSYIQMLSELVDESLTIFIPKVPYNLAILNINHAEEIRAAFSEITEWSIGGHSLGGTVACFVVNDHPNEYENLILLASYPSENSDLKIFKGTVVSIFGSMDGVADLDKLKKSKGQFNNSIEINDVDALEAFPETTYFVEIGGGNHSNFGNYGFQKGDNTSSISKEQQQEIAINYISKMVKQ